MYNYIISIETFNKLLLIKSKYGLNIFNRFTPEKKRKREGLFSHFYKRLQRLSSLTYNSHRLTRI